MPRIRAFTLLVLTPALLAWSGGGSGTGVWEGDAGRAISVDLSGLAETGSDIRIVANASIGDGEGLIDIRVPRLHVGTRISALDEQIEVSYREFAVDGTVRFASNRARAGWLEVSAGTTHVTLSMDVTWQDAHGAHRRWSGVFLQMGNPGGGSAGGSGRGGSAGGGCDVAVDPEPEPYYEDGAGCEGDDWESDDRWDDDSSGGGCEGDDLGGGDDYGSDSGGCEGDDLGGGDDFGGDSGGASCEGDAIASQGRVRRSPTAIRLLNQLPWMLVVVLLGVRPGRRRRR